MSQFAVYRNRNPKSRAAIPYLLDVQHGLFETMDTRVVVPLAVPSVLGGKAAKGLDPAFVVEETDVIMLTQELVGVSRGILGEQVTTLAEHRHEILAALDFLFTGI